MQLISIHINELMPNQNDRRLGQQFYPSLIITQPLKHEMSTLLVSIQSLSRMKIKVGFIRVVLIKADGTPVFIVICDNY